MTRFRPKRELVFRPLFASRRWWLRPAAIVKRYGLKNPIYFETAAYGHMGRKPGKKKVRIGLNGKSKMVEVETFTW